MQKQGSEFIGPTIHPIRKWGIGFAFLGLCAILLLLGTAPHGFPFWLQWIGWTLVVLNLLGGSLYLLVRSIREREVQGHRKIHVGAIAYLPRNWQRWLLDEPIRNERASANSKTKNDLE